MSNYNYPGETKVNFSNAKSTGSTFDPTAFGSFGQAADSDYLSDKFSLDPVRWPAGKSPLESATRANINYDNYLRKITKSGQINQDNLDNPNGRVVQYDVSRDMQSLGLKSGASSIEQEIKLASTGNYTSDTRQNSALERQVVSTASSAMTPDGRQAFSQMMLQKGQAATSALPSKVRNTIQTVGSSGVVQSNEDIQQYDSYSVPREFLALANQRQAAQNGNAPRPMAVAHPALSNFEDSTGQSMRTYFNENVREFTNDQAAPIMTMQALNNASNVVRTATQEWVEAQGTKNAMANHLSGLPTMTFMPKGSTAVSQMAIQTASNVEEPAPIAPAPGMTTKNKMLLAGGLLLVGAAYLIFKK